MSIATWRPSCGVLPRERKFASYGRLLFLLRIPAVQLSKYDGGPDRQYMRTNGARKGARSLASARVPVVESSAHSIRAYTYIQPASYIRASVQIRVALERVSRSEGGKNGLMPWAGRHRYCCLLARSRSNWRSNLAALSRIDRLSVRLLVLPMAYPSAAGFQK